jgi:hypothetical protein
MSAGADQAGRQERCATTELGDVETANIAEQAEFTLGQAEQPPVNVVGRPLGVGVGIGEPFVHERPQGSMLDKLVSSVIHRHILTRQAASQRQLRAKVSAALLSNS